MGNQLWCDCCGCQHNVWSLWPDQYRPTYHNIVHTRTRTTTTVDTRTDIYIDGELDSSSTSPGTPDTPPDVEVDSTDSVTAAGRFHYLYPETETENVTSDTTVGNTRTVVTEITKETVEEWIERRLTLEFDVSDVYQLFGELDIWGEEQLVTSHIRTVNSRWDSNATDPATEPETPHEVKVTFYGVDWDETIPADEAEFDSRVSAALNSSETDNASNESVEDHYITIKDDVENWLGSGGDKFLVYVYTEESGTDDDGAYLDDIELSLADRDTGFSDNTSKVDQEYDWHDDFERTALGTYEAKFRFPEEDYEFLFDSGDGWYDFADRTLRVDLYDESDTVVFHATFYVEIDPVGVPSPSYGEPDWYTWRLVSDGTAGKIIHREQTIIGYSSNVSVPPPIATWGDPRIHFRIHEGVISFGVDMLAEKDEGGVNTRYNWYPHWMSEHNGEQLKLKMTWQGGDYPLPDVFAWGGLKHEADNRNMDCPEGTCSLIVPYTHLQWRPKVLSIPGGTFVGWKEFIHTACTTQFVSGDGTTPVTTGNHSTGNSQLCVTYKASVDTVYKPTGSSGMFAVGTPYLGVYNRPGTSGSGISNFCVGATWEGFNGWIQQITIPHVYDFGEDCASNPPACYVGSNAGAVAEVATSELQECQPTVFLYNYSYESLDFDQDFTAVVTINVRDPHENASPQSLADLPTLTLADTGEFFRISEGGPGAGLLFQWNDVPEAIAVQQDFEPTYSAEMTAGEVTDIQNALTGSVVEWWYAVDDGSNPIEYRSITESATLGPVTSSGYVEPADKIRVNVILDLGYLSWYDNPFNPFATEGEYDPSTLEGNLSLGPPDNTNTFFPDSLPPGLTRPPDILPATLHDPVADPSDYTKIDRSDYVLVDPMDGCGSYPDYSSASPLTQSQGAALSYTVQTSDRDFNGTLTPSGPCTFQTHVWGAVTFGPDYDGVLARYREEWTESGWASTGSVDTGAAWVTRRVEWHEDINKPTAPGLTDVVFDENNLDTEEEPMHWIRRFEAEWMEADNVNLLKWFHDQKDYADIDLQIEGLTI